MAGSFGHAVENGAIPEGQISGHSAMSHYRLDLAAM